MKSLIQELMSNEALTRLISLLGREQQRLNTNIDVTMLYLAGALGNCISRASARRIDLIRLPTDQVLPAGNTALLEAQITLFASMARMVRILTCAKKSSMWL
jgi:uncharacterized 2Fe-2S/4Fe-4S cluster protein (DUF4445 family)